MPRPKTTLPRVIVVSLVERGGRQRAAQLVYLV